MSGNLISGHAWSVKWRPFWVHGVTLVGLGLPLGSLWGALGATLGAKKATREAPRRVTGPFGGPKGLWKGPGVILGVVVVSKKEHFEGSKPLDSIGRANEI